MTATSLRAMSRGAAPDPARRAMARALAAAAALATMRPLAQQPAERMRHVGYLAPDAASTRNHEGFREGMRDFGFVEGRNLAVDWRFAEGRYERLPALASELVGNNVDVIVAGTSLGVQAAAHATKTLPIVMVGVADPVGEGFARSLASPGGNITGLSSIVAEVSGKHIELLQTALPRLSRVAVLINPNNPSDALILEQVNGAAYARGVKATAFEAIDPPALDGAFDRIARERLDGVVVASDPFFDAQWQRIVQLSLRHRLPSICSSRGAVESGALMSYGQDLADHCKRAASYVQKIFAGAQPRSLPIEQPTVFELVVNQRTARTLGLSIPRELLLRADKVIE